MAKYAFTDIHGNYNLWLAIKNYCKEDDEIFFLGDAIDRGPDGIKIMQELFKDKRVTYIIGNHEDMFLDYVKNIDDDFCSEFGTIAFKPIFGGVCRVS